MSEVNSLYTVGRSKKNTVKVAPLAVRGYCVTLTEDGGQYSHLASSVAEVADFLGRMWGYGALAEITTAELTERVRAKLKLVSGPDVFA